MVGTYWSHRVFIHLLLDQDLKEVLNITTYLLVNSLTHKVSRNQVMANCSLSQKNLSADLTFDLRQQVQEPIGNGRRYCKIQYNDTGTGSYPLPVEVPSPVLLGVGARSRCRCSRSHCRTGGGGGGGRGGMHMHNSCRGNLHICNSKSPPKVRICADSRHDFWTMNLHIPCKSTRPFAVHAHAKVINPQCCRACTRGSHSLTRHGFEGPL